MKNKDFNPKDNALRWRTRSLFTDLSMDKEKYPPVYTLEEARQIYMNQDDPTEYKAAMALLGSWEHWLALVANPTLKPIVEKWREELSVKIRSEAIESIQVQAQDPKGFTAAKWLAEKGWEPKKGKGRPTKQDVARAAREEAGIKAQLQEDGARISLLQ